MRAIPEGMDAIEARSVNYSGVWDAAQIRSNPETIRQITLWNDVSLW